MSLEKENENSFIQERLDSLYEVDCKIVSLLDNMSSLFQTYSTPKSSDNDLTEQKEQIKTQTRTIYSAVSNLAIGLRKEVKIMDENIGVYNKNKDGIMILPISVDQKNTTLGRKKLNDEIKELNALMTEEQSKPEYKSNDGNQEAAAKMGSNIKNEGQEKQIQEDITAMKEELDANEDEDFDMIA